MINGPPKVVSLAADLHEHLVHVPFPVQVTPHRLRSPLADLQCEFGTEPLLPKPNRFIAHFDVAFVQQIFDIPE
jgi:hypothetical protein